MRYNKVTLRVLGENEYSIDFFHPIKVKSRIRRKIKADALTAQKIQNGIEYLISREEFYSPDSKSFARESLLKDSIFHNNSLDIVNFILEIFYSNSMDDTLELENYLDKKIPYPINILKVALFGNCGSGKSFVLQHFADFYDSIDFPFTDVSRANTFKTEYIFKSPHQTSYKFAVALLPLDSLKQQIENCIDRAIDSKIDYLFDNESYEFNSEEDVIISSFISDPNNAFDLRLILGSYYEVTSKIRQKESKQAQVEFWSKVYDYINLIFNDIKNSNLNFNLDNIEVSELSNKEFLRFKYYEYLSEAGILNDSNYSKLIDYIISEILNQVYSIKSFIESMPSLKDIEFNTDKKSNWYTGFSCQIATYACSEFKNFIKIFKSRECNDFRKILTPLVSNMRIELPFRDNISQEFTEQPIVLIDTVDINYSSEDNSSIINSTSFNLDKVDIILLVDDSRSSMSTETQNILRHLFYRVVRKKIFIAYTFFDELSKSEFKEDKNENSINEQKRNYLYKVQDYKLSSILKDNEDYTKYFIKDLKNRTFFISNIKYGSNESYSPVNELLSNIITTYRTGNNYLLINKLNNNKALIDYDYKKLPIIFFRKIFNKYIIIIRNSYITNPPNYKTTKSLTYTLSQGGTYFCDSHILKPVDDLYCIMIESLSSFILNPQNINFYRNDEDDNGDNYTIEILEKLNELVAENLSALIVHEFTNTYIKDKWYKLYSENGIGSDYRRRAGIVQIINEILPPIDTYINLNSNDNWIDKIENIIRASIIDLDELIKKENKKFKPCRY